MSNHKPENNYAARANDALGTGGMLFIRVSPRRTVKITNDFTVLLFTQRRLVVADMNGAKYTFESPSAPITRDSLQKEHRGIMPSCDGRTLEEIRAFNAELRVDHEGGPLYRLTADKRFQFFEVTGKWPTVVKLLERQPLDPQADMDKLALQEYTYTAVIKDTEGTWHDAVISSFSIRTELMHPVVPRLEIADGFKKVGQ